MPKPAGLVRTAQAPLALPSQLEAQSLALIEKTLGGREGLVAALSHAPKSRDIEYLLGLIGDPAHAKTPLGHLCAQGGVTPGELLAAWKSGEILRGHVLATRKTVEALPAIVDDILQKAAPYEAPCSGCQGLGTVTPEPTRKRPNPEPEPCPACTGSGRLLYPADLDRAKIALDLAQLTPKGGGLTVAVDARQAHLHAGGGGAAGGSLEHLLAASDRILYGDPGALPVAEVAPVDAEVVDADPPPGADSPSEEGTV